MKSLGGTAGDPVKDRLQQRISEKICWAVPATLIRDLQPSAFFLSRLSTG